MKHPKRRYVRGPVLIDTTEYSDYTGVAITVGDARIVVWSSPAGRHATLSVGTLSGRTRVSFDASCARVIDVALPGEPYYVFEYPEKRPT